MRKPLPKFRLRNAQNLRCGIRRLRFEAAERDRPSPGFWQLRKQRCHQLAKFPGHDRILRRVVHYRHHVLKTQDLVGLPVLEQKFVVVIVWFVQLDG